MEGDLRVHTFEVVLHSVFRAFVGSAFGQLVIRLQRLEATIGAFKPLIFADGTIKACALTKATDEIDHRSPELRDGEAAELLLRWIQPGLCLGRIEGIVNVSSDIFGILTDTEFRLIFRHGALDVFGQGRQTHFTSQHVIILILHPLAAISVAAGALFHVDGFAGMVFSQGGKR